MEESIIDMVVLEILQSQSKQEMLIEVIMINMLNLWNKE